MMTSNYGPAKFILGFIEFIAWAAVAVGLLIAIVGAEAGRQSFGSGGLMGALPGLGIMIIGFVCVALVQGSKAAVDTARMTRRMLDLAEEQHRNARNTNALSNSGSTARTASLGDIKTKPAQTEAVASGGTALPALADMLGGKATDASWKPGTAISEERAITAAGNEAEPEDVPDGHAATLEDRRHEQIRVGASEPIATGEPAVITSAVADAPPNPFSETSADDGASVRSDTDAEPPEPSMTTAADIPDIEPKRREPASSDGRPAFVAEAQVAAKDISTEVDASERPAKPTTPRPSASTRRRSEYVARAPRGLPPEHMKHKGRVIEILGPDVYVGDEKFDSIDDAKAYIDARPFVA